MTAPAITTGVTLTGGTSGVQAKILSLDMGDFEREPIPTSTFDTTGGKTFIPDVLVDYGEISGRMQFASAALPPITADAETWTVDWGDDSWSCSGFMTRFRATSPDLGGVQEADFTIKLSGSPSVA